MIDMTLNILIKYLSLQFVLLNRLNYLQYAKVSHIKYQAKI